MPNLNPNNNRLIRVVEWAIISTSISLCAMCALTLFVNLNYPYNPASFGNVLPNNWYFLLAVYIFSIYMISYCYIYFISLVASLLPLEGLSILFLVKELKIGRLRYYSIDSLRQPQNLQRVYRMGQILMLQINNLFGKLLLPMQTLATLLFVFGAYVAIKHHDKMNTISVLMVLGWTLSAAIGWGLILTLGGYLHSNGLKILTSWRKNVWKYRKERNEMKIFVKSCGPIVVCYGKIFVMRKVSLMIFVRGLTRGLVRVILTLDKHNTSK